jgi:nitrate reductase delta subunit
MPDYLPVVLEFVSTQPPRRGARLPWRDGAHLQRHLQRAAAAQQPYASVLGALLELSGEKAQAVKLTADEPLDATWEEPVVFDGCSSKAKPNRDQAQPIHFVKTDAAAPMGKCAAPAGASP